MTSAHLRVLSVALMGAGLIALLVESLTSGFTTLRAVGVACFVIAINAVLAAIREARLRR